jgi:hypothetical protein
MTEQEIEAAIAWFDKQEPPMPGARKMYRLAYAALRALRALKALEALKVDKEALEGLDREQLINIIQYLRASRIARNLLVDRLEDENYELRKKLNGGKDV